MKITKQRLKQIIKEELQSVIKENKDYIGIRVSTGVGTLPGYADKGNLLVLNSDFKNDKGVRSFAYSVFKPNSPVVVNGIDYDDAFAAIKRGVSPSHLTQAKGDDGTIGGQSGQQHVMTQKDLITFTKKVNINKLRGVSR
jgi:hypothetical protein